MNGENRPNRFVGRFLPAVLIISGILSFSAKAAQTISQGHKQAEGWQFTFAPYLWGAGIRGNVGHRATGTQFMKTDFSDIVRDLDVAVMGMGEARKGHYSLLVDLMYIDTSTHSDLPDGAPASRLKVDNRTVSGFLGGGYTLLEEGGGAP